MKLMKTFLKSLRANLFRFAVCVSFSASLIFVPASSAFAAPAVVPVAAEGIAQLLVALGLMTHDATTDLYDWRTDSELGRQFYTEDIFGNVVLKIAAGEPCTAEELEPLYGTVIPADLYTTDGQNYYLDGKLVTNTDLYVNADCLVGLTYSLPTNVDGMLFSDGGLILGNYGSMPFPSSLVGSDVFLIPFYTTPSGHYILSHTLNFPSVVSTYSYWIDSGEPPKDYLYENVTLDKFLRFPIGTGVPWASGNSSTSPGGLIANSESWTKVLGVDTNVGFKKADITAWHLIKTKGVPVFTVSGEKEGLDGAIVKPPEPPKNDDDKKPEIPESPALWQIWKSLEDLSLYLSTGEDTNFNNTFQDYVNNNYNYVDVDINVPDEINNNVNLSGGLDINGKGDITININEDVSLPSAGDGSGFYNPDAADIVGALGKDNPVVGVVSGLFSALDPALVGIFSISVSLLFVLGLWKLIRG